MHFSGINAHKFGCHLHKNEIFSFMFTDNQAEGDGTQ